jgi:protein MYSM1
MVKCQPFNGKPGSDAFGAQPFEMTVHSNVLLTMDFHAHLVSAEIIGFLAGEWDRTAKRK